MSDWKPMQTAPHDGSVFEARCGLYAPMPVYFNGWFHVFNDDEDGEISYPFTHWRHPVLP